MAKLLRTPNLNNAKISYPTIGLVNVFFKSNFNPFTSKFNPFSVFYPFSTVAGTSKQPQPLSTGGFNLVQSNLNPSKNNLWGIDIPVLIKNQNNQVSSNKNLLIIIGQDPLRKVSDPYLISLFPKSSTTNNSKVTTINNRNITIIGTPYAVTAHYYPNSNYKNSKNIQKEPYPKSKIYYHLIDKTLNLYYDVYLTDVFKYYPNQPNKKNPTTADLNLLANEINHFFSKIYSYNQVVILANGDVAESAISAIKGKLPTQKLKIIDNILHLSSTTNKFWHYLFKERPDIGQFIPKKIEKQGVLKYWFKKPPKGFANKSASDNIKSDYVISLLKEKQSFLDYMM